MGALTDNTIASTYKQLLKITSEGVGADASAKYVEDGLGTDTALSLSTTRIGIGTASPDNLLHIKTTGSTPSIELEQDAGTSYKALFKLAGNDLEIRGSSGAMEFYNGGNNDGDSATLAMTIDNSQNATFAGDILIAENIKHTGDTDTRIRMLNDNVIIYAGNENQLDIGNVITVFNEDGGDNDLRIESENNANMFYVDASTDRIGIGTASPESVLNLKTTKTVALSSMAHFLTLGLTIDDSTAYNTEGGGGGIAFRTGRNSSGTQTIYAAIDGAKEGTANDGYTGALRFYTNNNSTGVPTEHMRITSGGKVGIGTTSPGDYSTSADNLVVYDSAHAGITIVSANNKSGNLFFSDGTSGSEQYRGYLQYDHGNTLTDFLLIGTAGTEAIRIDASQNVAIGNGKSPGALLDIAYQGNDDYPVKIRGNIDNDGGFTGIKFGYEADTGNYEKCAIKVEGTSGNVQPNFHILLNSAASSADVSTDNTDAKFTILNGGNVGIGETSPDSLLHISGVGDNNHCITMDQSGRKNAIGNFYSSGSTLSQMQFYMSNGNTDGSANVRMRLFSGGELLVNRDSNPGGVINSNTMDGRWGIVVDDTYGNDAFIDFRDAGNSIGNITIVSGNVSYNTFIGSHYSSLTTDNEDNIEIGTVLSTIDETHTRHLAKFKISDAVGDTRVYGVFAGWDKMHEGEGSQATVSGLGATQVRVTGACQGGDLLESNGDGTAKVQSDDIIRSKTIGKVTIGDSDTSVKLVSCVLYCG